MSGKKGMHDKWRNDRNAAATMRARIQTGVILDRVNKHILGELDMSASQIQAAIALLRKTMPDLASIEATVETTSFTQALDRIAQALPPERDQPQVH